MNIEVHNENPINISFESKKTCPIIQMESGNNVNASLEPSKDINYHLHKHPELGIFFQTKVVAGGSITILTQSEFDALPEKDIRTIYLIVEGDDLQKLYIGSFLIAQKDENGFFPYSFPIIF